VSDARNASTPKFLNSPLLQHDFQNFGLAVAEKGFEQVNARALAEATSTACWVSN
jgi:hypothetical protein